MPNRFMLMWPTLQALKALGGSARISEVADDVIVAEQLTEEQQSVKRREGDHMSKIEYRLAWARNGLKLVGPIENSTRGLWSRTEAGRAFQFSNERQSNDGSEYSQKYAERKRQARAGRTKRIISE